MPSADSQEHQNEKFVWKSIYLTVEISGQLENLDLTLDWILFICFLFDAFSTPYPTKKKT